MWLLRNHLILTSLLVKSKRADCPARLHGYWNYCDEMSVNDGIMLKGNCCIVIPLTVQ